MTLNDLQKVAVDALEGIKAQDICVFDTTNQTNLFDRIIIASGTSNRQTRALANQVRENVKGAGGEVVGLEGEETGEWILVDLGDIVVHIMQPAIRAYYRLEEIWGEKELPLKSVTQSHKNIDCVAKEAAPMKKSRTEKMLVSNKTKLDTSTKSAKISVTKPRATKPRTSKTAS